MSFSDRESLHLDSLKELYEETIKKYNDSQSDELYNQCMELNRLIQQREIQDRNIHQNYVVCEICNKKILDTDEAKKDHQQKIHKTWVNYKPITKAKKTKQEAIQDTQDKTQETIHEEIKNSEEILASSNLNGLLSSQFEKSDIPAQEPQLDQVEAKTKDNNAALKLKKLAEEQRKEDENLIKTILDGLQKPQEQPAQKQKEYWNKNKEQKEEVFKEEKPSFFKKRDKEPKPTKPKKEKQDFGFPKRRYKKPHFALKGQFPILEVLLKGGPMILLKNADRSLEIIKAKRIQGKFVETNLGFFELDGEFENRFNSMTSFYVHNIHNSKPISVKAVEEIQRYYHNKEASIIVDEMEKIKNALREGDKLVDPITAMSTIFHDESSKISDLAKKFLIDFITFDHHDIALLVSDRITTKRPKLDISKPIQTTIPIFLLSLIGFGSMLIMRFFNPLKIFNISPEMFKLGFSFFGGT